jgi:hypothetical protein
MCPHSNTLSCQTQAGICSNIFGRIAATQMPGLHFPLAESPEKILAAFSHNLIGISCRYEYYNDFKPTFPYFEQKKDSQRKLDFFWCRPQVHDTSTPRHYLEKLCRQIYQKEC